MKKLLVGALVLIFAFALLGCSAANDSESTEQTTTEEDSIGEEISDEEFDKILEEDAKAEITDKVIFMPSFVRWGMSAAEVKDSDTREINNDYTDINSEELKETVASNSYISYYVDKWSTSFEYIYSFQSDKLKAYWINYSRDEKYIEKYNEAKEKLIPKYGNPSSEDIIWTDEAYKDQPDMWNKAFEYGYVTISTKWDTDSDTSILIKWSFKDGMNIMYCEKGFEDSL